MYLSSILIAVVAILHLCFLVLEMFLWEKDVGRKIFSMSTEQAKQTSVLAKNQGLYNGFLVAGLIWTFFIQDPGFQESARVFFLSCVIAAGVYGAFTAKRSILYYQAMPAILALLALKWSL